jgi:hypothetical protein
MPPWAASASHRTADTDPVAEERTATGRAPITVVTGPRHLTGDAVTQGPSAGMRTTPQS